MTDSKETEQPKVIKECNCDTPKETPKEAPKEVKQETQPTISTDEFKSMEQRLLDSLDAKLKGLIPAPQPTATVSSETTSLTLKQMAEKAVKHLDEYGVFKFDVPYETLRGFGTQKIKTNNGVEESYASSYTDATHIKEAYSISGTHATQDLDTEVLFVPGGNTYVPVRQFARTKMCAPGTDRARFFKATQPASLTQSVGSTATASSETYTSIEVTPSTVTGVYSAVSSVDIEDEPFDFMAAVIAGQTKAILDYEATDMLTTVSKEGTLTPGLWINAETGATITHSDNSGITFENIGVAKARAYLENQGYLQAGVRPVVVIHPDQWFELVTSTNVSTYVQQGVPGITTKGIIEELYGVQIVVCNAIENKDNTTTDAYNALMFVPNHSYGFGIKRDVSVKIHEVPEDNQIRVTTNWRSKSGVLDSSSIVRLSSSSPTI